MSKHLTDNSFWKNFWESKKNLIFKIKENYTFSKQLATIIKSRNIKTSIELGGFPGYYSIFLKKYFAVEATLFDYYIHKQIIAKLLSANDLRVNDIQIIEDDLFNYKPEKKYDLVCSFGLIEHFTNTEEIIHKHLQFVKDEGTLFITLPNFKSLNGWVQKTFDSYNYNKHYIECMDLKYLTNILNKLNLSNICVYYNGGFSLWLENKEEKALHIKLMVKILWIIGKIVYKIFPFESKWTSPYIVIEAKKNN